LAGRGLSPKEIESQASLASRTAEQILGDEPPFDELIERLPHPALQEEVRAARDWLQSAFDDEMARELAPLVWKRLRPSCEKSHAFEHGF
jgi:hypothetical protein